MCRQHLWTVLLVAMAAEDKAVQIAVPFCADDGEILLHQQGNWVEWDGGMIGGHPVRSA